MKVSEILEWPPGKWARDDGTHGRPTDDPASLRLLWFSTPDEDGWFSLTATDSQGVGWATYCRAPDQAVWRALERALGASLKKPLRLIGDLEVVVEMRPRSR